MFRPIAITITLFALSPSASMACPDYRLSGEVYKASGKDLYTEQDLEIRAGGEHSISGCGINPEKDSGRGYVTVEPDLTLRLSGMEKYKLVISTVSLCDSILLINTGATNWYYDDDDNGNYDAKVVLSRPSNGWYDIWLGTHDGETCEAFLSLETFKR